MPRHILPIRVHELWDCIGHRGAGVKLALEKLVPIASSVHQISRDELTADLESTVKEGLIKAEQVKKKGVMSTVYSFPEPEISGKGEHDWYCFACHAGGDMMVSCKDCPRVFHIDCLDMDRKPQQDLFVCPKCHIQSAKPSAEKLKLKQEQLNLLLTFICDEIKEWKVPILDHSDGKIWAIATHRDPDQSWRLNYLVHSPTDMTVIGGKASTSMYTCLEEFQVDCETLFHAVGCYFPPDVMKGEGIGAKFITHVMHEINEIQLCCECFQRSHAMGPNWFCLPCNIPHEVVWARLTGYPYWPAKVMGKEGNKYDVRYFGRVHDRAQIDGKNIMPIDTPLSTLKIRSKDKKAGWSEAYAELQKFLAIQKDPKVIDTLPLQSVQNTTGKQKSAAASPVSQNDKVEDVTPEEPCQAAPRQSNGIPTKKKYVTLPKSVGAASAAPVAQYVPDLGYLGRNPPGMAELFAEFEVELRQAYTLDAAEREQPAPSEETQVKVTENEVSSPGPSLDVVANGKQFVNVNAVVEKYKDKINMRYVEDISRTKRTQWCSNCERVARYHCCWNIAYCSRGCQEFHWGMGHKLHCKHYLDDDADAGPGIQAKGVKRKRRCE